jgi:hypothetical protein
MSSAETLLEWRINGAIEEKRETNKNTRVCDSSFTYQIPMQVGMVNVAVSCALLSPALNGLKGELRWLAPPDHCDG